MKTERERAMFRAIMQEESRSLREGDQNTSGIIGAAYPAMLYRKTDRRDEQVIADGRGGRPPETAIVNSFGGLLCDTIIAEDEDHAEALAAEGWDSSPEAAHGKVSGLVAATTAKDDEIAALRAQIAAMEAAAATPAEEAKRGPGRPPKQPVATEPGIL